MEYADPADNIEFDYVVESQKPQKICFGSSRDRPIIERDKANVQTMANPMTYYPEKYTGLSAFLNKPRSNKGVGGLASRTVRFPKLKLQRVPSPTRYNFPEIDRTPTDGLVPFGSKIPRKSLVLNSNPGPGTYNSTNPTCRSVYKQDNLGQPKVIPVTECLCLPTYVDTCSKCHKLCPSDYWHQNYLIFLCQTCMAEEVELHEMYQPEQLKKFKKIRNCAFKHYHENTFAAIRLIDKKELKKREDLENYLELFLKCFKHF